ncbi:colicin E3/pyocin S6 family cytotoxin [Paenibacillus spongiae]|uniref:colicin E3/pyocin S6 family cytotoxin n=1 Tax=Paenibacillus spongiae TaxID=2909671 RepID=UPI0035A26172
MIGDRKVWQSLDGKRLYTWDSLHGELEVFTKRGIHLASADPITGKYIKPALPGRRLNV